MHPQDILALLVLFLACVAVLAIIWAIVEVTISEIDIWRKK